MPRVRDSRGGRVKNAGKDSIFQSRRKSKREDLSKELGISYF